MVAGAMANFFFFFCSTPHNIFDFACGCMPDLTNAGQCVHTLCCGAVARDTLYYTIDSNTSHYAEFQWQIRSIFRATFLLRLEQTRSNGRSGATKSCSHGRSGVPSQLRSLRGARKVAPPKSAESAGTPSGAYVCRVTSPTSPPSALPASARLLCLFQARSERCAAGTRQEF